MTRRTAWIAASLTTLAALATTDLVGQRVTQRESHGEVRNRVTVSTVVAAIDNTPRVLVRLASLGDITTDRIRVVDVRPYIAASRRSTYDSALENGGARLDELRARLVSMDGVVRVLATQRPALTVDNVVAAAVLDVIETGLSADVLVLYADGRIRGRSRNGSDGAMAAYRPTSAALLAAVHATPEMVARVSVLGSLRRDRISFHDIDKILTPAEVDAYRSSVRISETSIRSLRAELSKRPLVMQALARHDPKLALGDIFVADITGSDDKLVLYFRRPD